MEQKDKPISTFHPKTDGHRGTREEETAGVVRRRYHAGHPETSGENDLPEGGTLPIHERDKKR